MRKRVSGLEKRRAYANPTGLARAEKKLKEKVKKWERGRGRLTEGLDDGMEYSAIGGQLQSVSPWDGCLNAWAGVGVCVCVCVCLYNGPVAISANAICSPLAI